MEYDERPLMASIDKQLKLLQATLPKPSEKLQAIVCIPAKNEQDFLPKTLEALINQTDKVGVRLKKACFEVIVLCHNCSDATYLDAIKFQKKHANLIQLHVLRLNSKIINNVGAARRILMHLAANRLSDHEAWIVSTDADTIPSNHWIDSILSQAVEVDMVCGKININDSNLSAEVQKLLVAKQQYNHLKTQIRSFITPEQQDPWPKHNHHSGPNMAIRKHAYASVDGIPPIPFLEDIALYKRVKAFGYWVRHANNVVVETSGRLYSKTESGLGSELKKWSHQDVTYKVETLKALKTRFTIYHMIKQLFYSYNQNLLRTMADLGFIPLDKVAEIYEQSAIYEEMMIKIEEELAQSNGWKENYPIQDIFEVNKTLEDYIKTTLAPAFAKA